MNDNTKPIGVPPPPAAMIHDLAAGMEEPVDIAFRYGYSASQWAILEEFPPFRQAVAAARSELEKGGHTVRTKARWMVDVLIEDLYLKSKGASVTIGQLQETVRVLARLGDLEPKPNAPSGPAAPAFTVTINIPQLPAPEAVKTIDGDDLVAFPKFEEKTDE